MATRYYTEEAYEQIKQTIQQIDNTDVCPVRDFFSALVSRIRQLLKLVSVDNYKEDMQSWYDLVLDSHNTTMSQVDSIFKAAEKVDFEYRDNIMNGAVDSIISFRSTLNTLRDVISGKTSLADGKAAADKFLAAGKSSLNTSYDAILTKMEQSVLWDASKELFGDAIKWGSSYLAVFTAKDPLSKAAAIKKFVDGTWATAHDLFALASIVILPPVALATKFVSSALGKEISYDNYLDTRFDQLVQAQNFKDTNSLSDWLGGIAEQMTEDLADCPESSPFYPIVKEASDISNFAYDISQTADIAADAYDILGDLKDAHDLVFGKYYSLGEYVDVFENKDGMPEILEIIDDYDGPILRVKTQPGEIIQKVVSNWTGLPTSGWSNPSKFDGNVYKTVGTLWSYGEKLLPDPVTGRSNIDELPDVFFNKFKDTKFLKNVFDFARDLDELVTKEPPKVVGKSQCGSPDSNWLQCEIEVS